MEQAMAMIFWLGQACFVIQTGGLTILTDPYARLGYEVERVEGVDVVTVSHEHFDHNNVAMAVGRPLVLRGLAARGARFNRVDTKVKDVRIFTVNSYHDEVKGAKRGKNAIFVFEVPFGERTFRLVHMGDFGEAQLGEARVAAIGRPDVLLIPVGGSFTIGPAEADRVIAELRPKIVVPMHYKTAGTPNLPIRPLSDFLKGKKNVVSEGFVSGNRLAIGAALLKKAEAAGGPLIVPLGYGPPPKPPGKAK